MSSVAAGTGKTAASFCPATAACWTAWTARCSPCRSSTRTSGWCRRPPHRLLFLVHVGIGASHHLHDGFSLLPYRHPNGCTHGKLARRAFDRDRVVPKDPFAHPPRVLARVLQPAVHSATELSPPHPPTSPIAPEGCPQFPRDS